MSKTTFFCELKEKRAFSIFDSPYFFLFVYKKFYVNYDVQEGIGMLTLNISIYRCKRFTPVI